MDNIQYNDFLRAAWDLAGEIAHRNVELIEPEPGSQHLEIDPECELKLCVQDPDGLETIKNKLTEFERRVSCERISDEKKKTV
jgi:hypothetical protein